MKDSSWKWTTSPVGSASRPASVPGAGSGTSSTSRPSRPRRASRATPWAVEATTNPEAVRTTASMTASPSGTSVNHPAGPGYSSSAATTRPRGESRVVVPRRRSPSTSNEVRASTSAITTVVLPAWRSRRWTSVRLHPTDTCSRTKRPSGERSLRSVHASGTGRSSQTSRVVGERRAEVVLVDLPSVFVARRVAGVEEPGAVGPPRHRSRSGLGDLVGEVRGGGDVEDPEHAALIAALRDPVGNETCIR